MTERSDTMPVIGRLDDQVEAVLINPVRRRPTHGEAERDESARPAISDEDANPVSPDESSRERRVGDTTLPVWML
jgi:hypothetical protein